MSEEIIFIYDTPATTWKRLIDVHNISYYLRFFGKIKVLYWSKDKETALFSKKEGKIVFYPYARPYNSGYITGVKYMVWVFKTLWKISDRAKDMIFVSVIPVWAGLPGLLVAKLKKKKIVLRIGANKMRCTKLEDKSLGVPRLVTGLKLFVLEIIYYLTIPFYDQVIAISQGVKEHIQGYGAKKTAVIPIRMNTERFRPGERPKNGNVILAVGQIKKRKGFEEIIEALSLLKKQGFSLKLVILGEVTNPRDVDFADRLKKKVRAEELNVEFKGYLPQEKVAEVYRQADIFVHGSYTETLGMVIMEAMLSGLPVVATRTDGGRYLVEERRTGFLVQSQSPEAIAKKIEILIKNPGLKKKMGARGRKRIMSLLAQSDQRNRNLWAEMFKK